jgi:predicted transcriptional regulator
MPTLIELTAQIVTAHAAASPLTPEELLKELEGVYIALQGLEGGAGITTDSSAFTEAPLLTIKQAFKKNEVICMVCGKGGFKTLKKHLTVAHQLTAGQYRKQFGIPSAQSLTAKSYTESRRKMAEDRGLTDVLAKAREARASKSHGKSSSVPAVRIKSPVPAMKTKPSLTAVKVKAAVPAKVENATAVPSKSKKVTPAKKKPAAKK